MEEFFKIEIVDELPKGLPNDVQDLIEAWKKSESLDWKTKGLFVIGSKVITTWLPSNNAENFIVSHRLEHQKSRKYIQHLSFLIIAVLGVVLLFFVKKK